MKKLVKSVLNEARVQRTIDPKLWASMSSMSSRLRATLGEDAKPMKKDDLNTLLQKYVAGLLTMKVACPNNVSEIEDNKAYKLIGMAYIEAGGSIVDIKKLYVENGGIVNMANNNLFNDPDDSTDTINEPVSDEVLNNDNINEEPETLDDIEDRIISTGIDEIEDDGLEEPIVKTETPSTVNNTAKREASDTKKYIQTYLKYNREINGAHSGAQLSYDEEIGEFTIEERALPGEKFPIACGNGFANLDKKARFFIIGDEEYTAGHAGNNGVYDDYYFKRVNDNKRLAIKAGSNYYMDEVTKGKFYTQILTDNGFNPAMHVTENVDNLSINDVNALKILRESSYLPTLQELCNIINMLPTGTYWTSSVAKDGTTNIALSVNPDKILINAEKAKVITFIKFD